MSKSEVSPTQKILNIWAIILIIWSFYRATFKSDLPIWFDEFVAKPLVFLVPIYWFITKSEKKDLWKGLGFFKKDWLKEILFGICVGSIFIGLAFIIRIIKGFPFPSLSISYESIMWVSATVMAASLEQILSTGFIFKRLSEESRNIAKPLVVSALLFFFLHVPVLFGADRIAGSTLVQMIVMNTMLSLTTSVVFLMRKNTIAPVITHTLYLLSLPILL